VERGLLTLYSLALRTHAAPFTSLAKLNCAASYSNRVWRIYTEYTTCQLVQLGQVAIHTIKNSQDSLFICNPSLLQISFYFTQPVERVPHISIVMLRSSCLVEIYDEDFYSLRDMCVFRRQTSSSTWGGIGLSISRWVSLIDKLLLALAKAVNLGSESYGTHDYILFSDSSRKEPG
jgi:hypothetical protein